jgi:hypothetical protein
MFDIEALIWGHYEKVQADRMGEPIGPSGVHSCLRQQAYAQLQFPATEPVNTGAADAGSLIHLGIESILEAQPEIETEVRIQPVGLKRAGSADVVAWDEHVLVDIKTFGSRAYDRRVEAGGPYPHQWDQTEIYGVGLYDMADDGEPWLLQILAVNRDTGEHTVWEKPQDLDRGRELVHKIVMRQDQIDRAIVDVNEGDETPDSAMEMFDREGDGPGRGFPCDWCPFLSACWPSPVDEGLSPQSQTVVDDPEQVAEKAAEYRQAAAEAKHWTDRKYAAQAFLKGITGTFGGFKIAQVGGGAPTEAPDVDAMVERFIELGEPVPMLSKPGRKPYPKVTAPKQGL